MFFKVKRSRRCQAQMLIQYFALTTEGKKEILGIYLAEAEGAKVWLQILTDLQLGLRRHFDCLHR
jgi:transposase-like protein